MMMTQKQVRVAFWDAYPSFDHQARAAGIRGKRQTENYQRQCMRWICAYYHALCEGRAVQLRRT